MKLSHAIAFVVAFFGIAYAIFLAFGEGEKS